MFHPPPPVICCMCGMELKALITIVVPIYQVEAYLERCIDSIRAQTLTAFTCLLLDDGSGDGAGTLCREVIARDARFRLIHQPNAGLSAARNRGLDTLSASCDYVTFVLRFPVRRIYEDCALTDRLLYPEPAVALTRAWLLSRFKKQ